MSDELIEARFPATMTSNVKLELNGVGDVEVECYRNLRAGQRILLWYEDDNVWHENMVAFVIGGEEAVIYTPDDDLYIERLGCKGIEGPIRLRGLGRRNGYPRGLHGRIYQFREAPDDDLIRKVIRNAIRLVEDERGETVLPATVLNASGAEVNFDDFFGGSFIRRRLRKTEAAAPGAAAVMTADGPLEQQPGVLQKAVVPRLPPEGYIWLAAEPLGGFNLGQEVSLNPGTDIQIGDRTALAWRGGHWVKVELSRYEDASDYAASRRRLFEVSSKESAGQGDVLNRISAAPVDDKPKDDAGEDVRTLWVDFDAQGERFKTWRDAVRESHVPGLEEKPLGGRTSAPPTPASAMQAEVMARLEGLAFSQQPKGAIPKPEEVLVRFCVVVLPTIGSPPMRHLPPTRPNSSLSLMMFAVALKFRRCCLVTTFGTWRRNQS